MKLDLSAMSRQEKLLAMEALWKDLSADEQALESPVWHKAALQETEESLQHGSQEVVEWEAAKEQLRSRAR